MIKKIFLRITPIILKRNDIELSEDIPLSYFFLLSLKRLGMLIRGKVIGPRICDTGKRLYIGNNVKLRCKKKIHLGNGVTIQDNAYIDALSHNGVVLKDNASIGVNTMIKCSGSLANIGQGFVLGRYSTLANDCFVGAAGGVIIGDYVAIGQNVRFHSENHIFSDTEKKICEQGTSHKGILVGNDCWIGAGAVFLDGAEIGDGCVVGANALVNRKFEDHVVIAGIPAKIIKIRQ